MLTTGRLGFDVCCLLAALRASGTQPRPSLVLLAYAAANVIALVPIIPGGLGLVEASLGGLGGLLILAGVHGSDAFLPTLAYRLASYWLPLSAWPAVLPALPPPLRRRSPPPRQHTPITWGPAAAPGAAARARSDRPTMMVRGSAQPRRTGAMSGSYGHGLSGKVIGGTESSWPEPETSRAWGSGARGTPWRLVTRIVISVNFAFAAATRPTPTARLTSRCPPGHGHGLPGR